MPKTPTYGTLEKLGDEAVGTNVPLNSIEKYLQQIINGIAYPTNQKHVLSTLQATTIISSRNLGPKF